MSQQFEDSFARKFYYLRLSITDVCNFKCNYCLPDGYKPNTQKEQFLSVVQIKRIVNAFASCGCNKVRITGGEPSLRKDFTQIISTIADTPNIDKIAVTTNGYRMQKDIALWKDAGLTNINVSLDSLDPRVFYQITGENKFTQVMQGIDAAFEAGYSQIKVNAVLMKNFNADQLSVFLNWIKHRPIQLRFIELMQTGMMDDFFNKNHVSGMSIYNYLVANGWVLKIRSKHDGPAKVFCHTDYKGEIGLIMPYEKNFCDSCNRLRISATGKLHLCLFGEQGIELRDLLEHDSQKQELITTIQNSLQTKEKGHFLLDGNSGITPHLASIGG